jgi:hypothetical protein
MMKKTIGCVEPSSIVDLSLQQIMKKKWHYNKLQNKVIVERR